jgi:nucleotide-binding universal stress UspA family protein
MSGKQMLGATSAQIPSPGVRAILHSEEDPMTRTTARPDAPTQLATAGEDQMDPAGRGPVQILLATDGSESAAEACRLIRDLPLPVGSAVQVLSVVPGPQYHYAEWALAQLKAHVEGITDKAAACVRRSGVEVSTTCTFGEIVREITAAAQLFDADLIVAGSAGRTGLAGFLLGSVARNVAHHADRPVLVARHPRGAIRKAVLAVDGSAHADEALEFACRFPFAADTEVRVCAVARPQPLVITDPLEVIPEYAELVREALLAVEREAGETVDRACLRLGEAGVRAGGVVRNGDPGDQLIRLMQEEHADLVIAGARGTSLLKGLGLGSVADRLLKGAPASVLLVRRPD